MMRHSASVLKRIPALLAVLLAAVLLLCLQGCHGKAEMAGFEVPEAFDESKNIEITFWAKNDTNKTQVQTYSKAIEGFETLYPNVKVNIRLYTDYAKIYNDVITNIATGTTPNICISYPDHIATYLTGENTVVALDNLMDDDRYGLGGSEVKFDAPKRSELIPEFLEEGKFGGYYYDMPYMRSTEALYINKTYVEKLGYEVPDVVTWDWIWEVSEAATAKDSSDNYIVNGQNVMIPFIYKSTDNMMIQMLRQRAAGYSSASGEIQIFNDTTKEILYTIAQHVKTGAFSTFKSVGYPGNFINAGRCIFAVDSTAGATWMGSNAPLLDIHQENVVQFETAVRTIPQFDTEHQVMISQGPSMCIFNKEDPQEVLASWLFMQYLLTNDIQIAYAQTEGYVPVTSKAQESAEYKDYLSRAGEDNSLYYDIKIEATRLLLAHTSDTFVTPVFNGSASLRDAAGQLIENVRKSANRGESIDEEYMQKLFSDVSALYRLDQIDISRAAGQDLGPLPKASRLLLGAIVFAWVCIGAAALAGKLKRKNVK